MRRSSTKRLRITKNGKVIRRPMAAGHNRTRKSTKLIRSKKKGAGLNYPMKTLISY